MEKYLTIADVCEQYALSRKTVERWILTRSLPAIKLNKNNGSVRIQANAFEKWIHAQNDYNPIKKMRWCEYELKYKVTVDLHESKNSNSGIVQNYDGSKMRYPQDFYVLLHDNSEILINITQYSEIIDTDSSRESIKNKFIEKFGNNIYLIIIQINVNSGQVKSKDIRLENIVFNIIDANEVLEFDILEVLSSFKI